MLKLLNVSKSYVMAESLERFGVLDGLSLTLERGQFISVVGPSGSGKSTLLNICGLLESADVGSILLDGVDYFRASAKLQTKARKEFFGFIYQFHHLLPEFTVWENLSIIQRISGYTDISANKYIEYVLEHLGLSDKRDFFPKELSGGQQERVAIARALCKRPKFILADEPTGNLDAANAQLVFDTFKDICKNDNIGILMVTHNMELAKKTDKVCKLSAGKLINF